MPGRPATHPVNITAEKIKIKNIFMDFIDFLSFLQNFTQNIPAKTRDE
jgi:hypothetical protein